MAPDRPGLGKFWGLSWNIKPAQAETGKGNSMNCELRTAGTDGASVEMGNEKFASAEHCWEALHRIRMGRKPCTRHGWSKNLTEE